MLTVIITSCTSTAYTSRIPSGLSMVWVASTEIELVQGVYVLSVLWTDIHSIGTSNTNTTGADHSSPPRRLLTST